MIPNTWELEYTVLGRWLERARDVRDCAYRRACVATGLEVSTLDNDQLLLLALELSEEERVLLMDYLNARLWQEQLAEQRLERSVLDLNGNGALVENHWDVAQPPLTQMHRVYAAQKARYHRTGEE